MSTESFPQEFKTPQDAGAFLLALEGIFVFPIRKGKKFPPEIQFVEGPVPGSRDPKQLTAWAKQYPGCNWAVRTGVVDGGPRPLLVLDQDAGAADKLPGKIPPTRQVKTPNGIHFYFWLKPGERIRNGTATPAKGFDIRGEHGYVIAPGSVADGKRYKVQNPNAPIADCPDWLRKALRPLFVAAPEKILPPGIRPVPAPVRHAEQEVITLAPAGETIIDEGQRNSALTSVAGAMRRTGMDQEAITAALLIHNRIHCQPLLDDREVRGIAASVSRYEPPPEQPNFTDSGNSDRLIARYGKNLRFDHNRRAWFVWDGRRFRPDTRNRVKTMARGVARDLFVAAALETNDAERKRILRWAIQTENRHRRENLVAVTEPVEGIASLTPDFDRDPWVLNFHNGVLDLEKQKLRKQIQRGRPAEPRREDMISKLCAGPYEPEATCPQFMAFLERIFDGDKEMLSYICRMAGYFLTGVTWERCFFLGYGPIGGNGKTTLSEVFRLMLGDYGQTAAVQTFLKGRSDKVRDDLAKLPGARVVCTPEPSANQQLDEATIKLWTGGEDEIQARPLYGKLFEFKPTGKLFMICNHKPVILGTDNAIWDRVHLIPFDVSIPKPQRDKKLLQKLKAEFPGILAWAVRGCLDWQERESLDPPKIVLSATDSYRNEMDRVKAFLAECCTLTPTARVEPRKLHAAYREWCGADWSLGLHAFLLRLQEQGFSQQRTGAARYWKGIGLLVHEEQGRLDPAQNPDEPF